jgi:hypothetical protein
LADRSEHTWESLVANTLINSLGGIYQLGMVVSDLDVAMQSMLSVGMGPFFVLKDCKLEGYEYRGKPAASPVLDIAFVQAGPVQIEVICQRNAAPSAYTDFLAQGREGSQHLSVRLSSREDYDRAYDGLLASGLNAVHQGGSRETARYVYFESNLPGALMIELSESQVTSFRAIADTAAKAAAEWDGSEPIRYLG